jgi:hypothetical protein
VSGLHGIHVANRLPDSLSFVFIESTCNVYLYLWDWIINPEMSGSIA